MLTTVFSKCMRKEKAYRLRPKYRPRVTVLTVFWSRKKLTLNQKSPVHRPPKENASAPLYHTHMQYIKLTFWNCWCSFTKHQWRSSVFLIALKLWSSLTDSHSRPERQNDLLVGGEWKTDQKPCQLPWRCWNHLSHPRPHHLFSLIHRQY